MWDTLKQRWRLLIFIGKNLWRKFSWKAILQKWRWSCKSNLEEPRKSNINSQHKYTAIIPGRKIRIRIQNFIQQIESGTIGFDPYCPFKDLIEISILARIFSPKLGNVHLTLIYLLVLNIYWKIVSGTVWFDPYSPLQRIYQVFMKRSCFFCVSKVFKV